MQVLKREREELKLDVETLGDEDEDEDADADADADADGDDAGAGSMEDSQEDLRPAAAAAKRRWRRRKRRREEEDAGGGAADAAQQESQRQRGRKRMRIWRTHDKCCLFYSRSLNQSSIARCSIACFSFALRRAVGIEHGALRVVFSHFLGRRVVERRR